MARTSLSSTTLFARAAKAAEIAEELRVAAAELERLRAELFASRRELIRHYHSLAERALAAVVTSKN
jgi:hypothetical protein